MSRIGKKPIIIPQGVSVKKDEEKIIVSGPKGELSLVARPEINVEIEDKEIIVSVGEKNDRMSKKNKAFWGLTRALIANMVYGVSSGYIKELEIEGVGYKALVEGNELVLSMGFSHLVKMKIPSDILVSVEKNNIVVSGIDKGIVTQFAAKIKKVKPVEPYKGKGIRYKGQVVRRKAGKKVAAKT